MHALAMSFERVCALIEREQVLAGMERMQPEIRTMVTQLLARFADKQAAPLPVAQEGAALALWGTDTGWKAFLEWHREVGKLARAVEVLLAAVTYQRMTYEWNSSIWALRRARPSEGFYNLGPNPWLWMRDEVASAKPAERDGAREVANRASKAWLTRAALAIVFPDDKTRWTAADEAELRHLDADDSANQWFGVLVAMRDETLDTKKIASVWRIEDAVTAKQLAKLGDGAVAPLRLMRAFEALAEHEHPDALRALAEFSDEAWESLSKVKPSKHSIEALAPMFTRLRPKRTLGLQLARALFDEHVVAEPKLAEALGKSKSVDAQLIAKALADTGAMLPADESWTSPWVAPTKSKAATPAKSAKKVAPAREVKHADKIHWKKGEREELVNEYADQLDAKDEPEREKRCLKEAKAGTVLMLDIHWMRDAAALRTWKAIEPKKWYGQVDDVQTMLARFGLDELDSVIAYVKGRPEVLAGLANVESTRVAPLMARGYALLKKHQATGKAWLDRFPEAAAIGLLRVDPEADKKQRDANEKALAYLSKHHAKIVESVIARAGGGVSTAQLATADAPTLPARKPKLPAFVELARLPRPIRTDGKAALAGDALEEFTQVLKATLPGSNPALVVSPLVDALAQRYTPESLARYAWSLFRQWLFADAPPKDKWALYAVGKFPADDHARALGRLARVWAPKGNSSRAQEAVESLATMRTQTALIEIYDISRKVQSKALKARAETVFETVASQLGISPEELADRLVPELSEQDLTFDDARVEFDGKLEPRLATAPAKDSDDAKRFKELQKLCRGVARGQLARLEQAMAEGHRMPFEHFAEVYQMHSLIRHLSRGLLWGAYRDSELVAFALDDDGPVDIRGKPIELPLDARYGVVHPAELAEVDRAKWTKRFTDQPFPQLAREVFTATTVADVQKKLAKFRNRTVQTAELLGLQRRGWRRGESPQGGMYYTMQRDGDGWSAELAFNPGIYLGSPTEAATQVLEAVVFQAIGAPPASILSDIQRDIAQLAPR